MATICWTTFHCEKSSRDEAVFWTGIPEKACWDLANNENLLAWNTKKDKKGSNYY